MKKFLICLLLFAAVFLLGGCFTFRSLSLEGKELQFETVDLDGGPVRSDELFARHELTLLNLWATWCGPCISELHDLNTVNEKLDAMDCGVVGLLNENEPDVALAKRYLSEKGADYPVILAPGNMMELIRQSYFPMTVFVNREGVIVGNSILGAPGKNAVEFYLNAAEKVLEKTGKDEQK